MEEEIFNSPNEWVAQHIRRFIDTDGQARPGTNDLLLTSRGRRSGTLRRTVLVFARDGDRYIVAASNAGAVKHPPGISTWSTTPASRCRSAQRRSPRARGPQRLTRSRGFGRSWSRPCRPTASTRR